jgi:hypothetical protein
VDGRTLQARELAAGRYRVCTVKAGIATMADMTRCAEGFLPPYGELRLTIP